MEERLDVSYVETCVSSIISVKDNTSSNSNDLCINKTDADNILDDHHTLIEVDDINCDSNVESINDKLIEVAFGPQHFDLLKALIPLIFPLKYVYI